MVEHYASVTVHAPAHQVYTLFTHFHDFPKFMHFVKEVTYYDDQRSHWVVQVLRQYEWDAVNVDWIPDQQVGWRSTSGLHNSGKVQFQALGPNRTMVHVYLSYAPPTGALGALGETLGFNTYFESLLQEELNNFALMVEQAPPGALDPMSSHYLFHSNSATARKAITSRQSAAMAQDPMMSPQALAEREARIKHAEEMAQQAKQRREEELKWRAQQELQARQELLLLEREAATRSQALREREQAEAQQRQPHPIYDTLGGRNAAVERTALGDKDALRPRYPWYEQDPMVSRLPKPQDPATDELEKLESPWLRSIRGSPLELE
ncbi:MAG: hypothetical protein E6J34_05765 [Chloroflexi bacterium]|nr:MAG: hypothetical protein E6J34_05765 [Chloroflexota bacterium]